ncbi:hypothetical protein EDD15DRAFT_1134642 [Pisolithus albus]|nr:hypothetical protein EDD15DRAFT_1134642 [Pisolithus albus]
MESIWWTVDFSVDSLLPRQVEWFFPGQQLIRVQVHSSFPLTSSSIRAWWIGSRTLVLISYIEGILLTNRAFFTLEERQRECRLYIDHVGDLQETHMPHMRVYPDYRVNQANTGKVLQSLRDANLDLFAQLRCLREDSSAREY